MARTLGTIDLGMSEYLEITRYGDKLMVRTIFDAKETYSFVLQVDMAAQLIGILGEALRGILTGTDAPLTKEGGK